MHGHQIADGTPVSWVITAIRSVPLPFAILAIYVWVAHHTGSYGRIYNSDTVHPFLLAPDLLAN
jgi:hypothetical protein